MVVIGSLGVFFYNYFLLLGTARLEAQTAFVINELWPALIILFSWWILGEKMNIGKAAAVVFSFPVINSQKQHCCQKRKCQHINCIQLIHQKL